MISSFKHNMFFKERSTNPEVDQMIFQQVPPEKV